MDFAAVAHDLRSPLAAMLGQTQLLAFDVASDSGQRRLRVIQDQIQRMVTLIERCTHEQAPPARAVDLNAIINAVVASLEGVCQRRGVTVTVSSDRELPAVAGDAVQLHRLLMNLLTNAIDAMPEGGPIVVHAGVTRMRAAETPAVSIDITDSGTGIPDDVISRVFQRGFTTKPAGEGSGLGLAICREIVQAHSGVIELKTRAEQGTTVQVWLPIARGGSLDVVGGGSIS
jgi:signal transduction histidine kinase